MPQAERDIWRMVRPIWESLWVSSLSVFCILLIAA